MFKYCDSCGYESAMSAKFCNECGARYEVVEPPEYAGFWRRVAAQLVDGAILSFLFVFSAGCISRGLAQAIEDPAASMAASSAVLFVAVIIFMLYGVVLESSKWQATVGKKLAGIVVSGPRGERVSFFRSLGRNTLKSVFGGSTFNIDYLVVAFTAKKQAWHDMPVSCLVTKKQPMSFLLIPAFILPLGFMVWILLSLFHAGAPLPDNDRVYIGHWLGNDGSCIEITENGYGAYERHTDGIVKTDSENSGKIVFKDNQMLIDSLLLIRRFTIDKAPSTDSNTMTLDGVEYRREAPEGETHAETGESAAASMKKEAAPAHAAAHHEHYYHYHHHHFRR